MFDFDDHNRDPRNPNSLKQLNTQVLKQVVQSLRYLNQFHTTDVSKHSLVMDAHANCSTIEDFEGLIEFWMKREALFLGLRGPLPGDPKRGKRWAWQASQADLTEGEGGAPGPRYRV